MVAVATHGQITGKAWQDLNANGRDETTEHGVGRIKVNAYSAMGQLVATAFTNANGQYHLSVPAGEAVRLEFSNLPAKNIPTAGRSLLRFVSSPAEANLSVYNPAQYVGLSPRIAQTIFSLGTADSLRIPTLQLINLAKNESKARLSAEPPKNQDEEIKTGSIWGLAYDRNQQRLFASSLAKRHSPFGPLGSGGIYVYDLKTNTTEPFISLSPLTPNGGITLVPPLGVRGLGGPHDSLTFSLVGKIGLGGIDVSDDGQFLFVMNLYDRKLYQIALPQDGSRPTATDITAIDIPLTGCTGGEARPFAVKYFGDKVYVGVTCDAQKSQNPNDLKAFVYQITPIPSPFPSEGKGAPLPIRGGAGGGVVLEIPLNYPRGTLDYGISGWFPWVDDYNQTLAEKNSYWMIHPQPMLADIEFDTDGSMILSLMDRLGHQTGDGQLFRPKAALQLHTYRALSGGDVLRAAYINDRYELEKNGRAGNRTTKGQNNGEGPSGGEFYFDDAFTAAGVKWHKETAMGGLAILPETDELLVASREPETNVYTTGGIKWFNNHTGATTRALSVFPSGEKSGYFWKTNNVGDIEIIPQTPPTEIGDRVWEDCNGNGLQDANEPALPNVIVQLFKKGKLVGTTQTNAEGLYLFNNQNVQEEIQAMSDYEIRVPLSQSLYSPFQLTAIKQGGNSELDNDAELGDKAAIVKFRTTAAGENIHHLDIGIKCVTGRTANETDAPLGLSLYPNPTTGRSTAFYKSAHENGNITYDLIDLQGHIIETRTGALEKGVHRTVFDLSRQPEGQYEIVVTDSNLRTNKPIIKQ